MNLERLSNMFRQLQDETLTSFEHLTNGLANDAYLVTTETGKKFVIKVLRLQKPEGISTEVAIQKQLATSSVVTPNYLALMDGNYIGKSDDRFFVVSEYIEGESPKSVTVELVTSFGERLAYLHDFLSPDALRFYSPEVQWLNLLVVKAEVAQCNSSVKQRLQKALDHNTNFLELELPKAVIHGDLRPNNVFAKNDKVTVIFDFETIEYTFRILDISQTYLALASKNVPLKDKLLSVLCDGYNSKAKARLSVDENAALAEAIKYTSVACGAWCFNNGEADYAELLLKIVDTESELQ